MRAALWTPDADVALLADPRLAGVQAHPHLDLDSFGPRVRCEVALRRHRGPDGVFRRVRKAMKNESPCVSTSWPP